MNAFFRIIKNGIVDENPAFVQVIGMCPLLAVTTTATDGIGMGMASTFVLACSNVVISLIRKVIPNKVRIPCFIVVIASFVTIVEFLLKAYWPDLNKSLGIFIPLIVVNCMILARAESYASKNNPLSSLFDGIGMGIGFTLALFIMGSIREILGSGAIFGCTILPDDFPRTVLMILPPGAFITLGLIMALLNYFKARKKTVGRV